MDKEKLKLIRWYARNAQIGNEETRKGWRILLQSKLSPGYVTQLLDYIDQLEKKCGTI